MTDEASTHTTTEKHNASTSIHAFRSTLTHADITIHRLNKYYTLLNVVIVVS